MRGTQVADFIPHDVIDDLLREQAQPDPAWVRDILAKAREAHGLEPEEVAALIHTWDPGLLDEMYAAAHEVKETIYGKRLVFFAPLYFSNYCVNNCRYCGYRRDNRFPRRRLTLVEVAEEVRVLEQMGHKRLALEAGEDPVHCPIDYVVDVIETVYATKEGRGEIRRVNVNIAATTVEEYRLLKQAHIGTYILFQETYHRPTYAYMHPSGPKSDYDWHTTAMDRAMEAGLDDVGIGALFGLYDWRFEVLGLVFHARHLDEKFGVGCHTISVPRLRPAAGVDLAHFPHLVSDADFKKLIAILRLAVPYTGMILSTRERPEFRDELFAVGISQISAGSRTGVGAYRQDHAAPREACQRARGPEATPDAAAPFCGSEGAQDRATADGEEAPQFQVEDLRTPDEVICSLAESGYIPSFCTACYRRGRTGERFMRLAKTGWIQNLCQPNALMTFKEYLEDYASPRTRAAGEECIRRHVAEIKHPAVRRKTEERLRLIEQGQRDLYF
ncbi:MAG: [FeFe] hydrogenase H-cluster radical SAM maturase HydG [Firmicutes bacterium]|nr:[FeFe] hydrogenase H-cluster radical SAM maturase HydG [Bacillota bacterium]